MMFIFFALLVSHLVLTYYIASDLYIIAKQLSKKEETENDDS